MSTWKKIWLWLKERGFSLRRYKYSLYLFLSMMAVVGCTLLGLTPLLAVIIVISFGVLKQLIWDVIWHKQAFDWKDLLFMLIGCAFGFLFTCGYYRWVV